jgi:RND family efflux transporter MFP subunit
LTVGPEVAGYRVAEVRADVGDKVHKGDELARLNTDMLNAELAAKRAAMSKAQAQQAKAQADFNRAQTLAASKLLSTAELERVQTEMLSSAAETELAKANLDTADLRLRYARIVAPADGVISARKVNIGQIAQVNEEMFRLLRDGRIEWRAEIPEALLTHIHKGQPVTIKLADGAALSGNVRVVAPTVNTSDRTAMVYVELPQPGPARPGMFARGEFALGQSNVPMIPLTSVLPNDGYSYVFVLKKDFSVERRRIETGQIEGDSLEVIKGLAANEQIVETGAAFLKDGDRVRVVTGKQP